MTARKPSRKATPPLAHYAEKDVTPVIEEFAAWLTEQTGYEVDLRSVYPGSSLRATFQKSEGNQARIAARAAAVAADKLARAERKAEPKPTSQTKVQKAAATRKPRTIKDSTIATADGVVIAEQRHVTTQEG